jgi:hypothetical protein
MDELFAKLDEIKDPKVKELAQRDILADLYRNNFYCFARDLVGFKDINWRTHGELCRALEAKTTRKSICFPRGAFKSSLAVIAYSMWKLIRNPEERILIDSELGCGRRCSCPRRLLPWLANQVPAQWLHRHGGRSRPESVP